MQDNTHISKMRCIKYFALPIKEINSRLDYKISLMTLLMVSYYG